MHILPQFTPDVEIYSIDEAFLQFKGYDRFDLEKLSQKIKRTLLQCIGLPKSIRIAPTKALAKLANKIAKKFDSKTDGVYVIDSELKIW